MHRPTATHPPPSGAAAAGAGVAAAFGFSGGAVAQPAKMATKGATTHKNEINLTPLFVEFLNKFMLFPSFF